MVYSLLTTLNKSLQTPLETEFQLISTVLDKTTWEHCLLIVRYTTSKTISKTTHMSKTTTQQKEILFPQFNVASYKRPGIRLSFEDATTLLPGGRGEGRIGTAMVFRKMPSKYAIFSTVLSKIVAFIGNSYQSQGLDQAFPSLDSHKKAIQIRSFGH